MSKTAKLFFFCLTFFLLATKIGLTPIFAITCDYEDNSCCADDSNGGNIVNGYIFSPNEDLKIGVLYSAEYDLSNSCPEDSEPAFIQKWISGDGTYYSSGYCGSCVQAEEDSIQFFFCKKTSLNDQGGCQKAGYYADAAACSSAHNGATCYEDASACSSSIGHGAICQEYEGELSYSGNPSNSLTLNLDVVKLKYSDLESMNPLKFSSVFSDPSSRTPGAIINRALTVIIFPVAGIGLLILILWGGFQMISGSTTGKQNNIDMGKKRITTAIIGFIVLFCVYWIWRLITLATGLYS